MSQIVVAITCSIGSKATLLMFCREHIAQALHIAKAKGKVAPSPAVSLLERARTIKSLPTVPDVVLPLPNVDVIIPIEEEKESPQVDDSGANYKEADSPMHADVVKPVCS